MAGATTVPLISQNLPSELLWAISSDSHVHPVHNNKNSEGRERCALAAVRSALPGWNTEDMFLLGDRFLAVTKTSRAVVRWLEEGGLSTSRMFSLWGVTQMRVGLTKAVLAWAAASATERNAVTRAVQRGRFCGGALELAAVLVQSALLLPNGPDGAELVPLAGFSSLGCAGGLALVVQTCQFLSFIRCHHTTAVTINGHHYELVTAMCFAGILECTGSFCLFFLQM